MVGKSFQTWVLYITSAVIYDLSQSDIQQISLARNNDIQACFEQQAGKDCETWNRHSREETSELPFLSPSWMVYCLSPGGFKSAQPSFTTLSDFALQNFALQFFWIFEGETRRGEGPQQNLLSQKPPSKDVIFCKGTDLCRSLIIPGDFQVPSAGWKP